MRRFLSSLVGLALVAALTVAAAGCGGQAEKGINKDKDRPKAEEKKT